MLQSVTNQLDIEVSPPANVSNLQLTDIYLAKTQLELLSGRGSVNRRQTEDSRLSLSVCECVH